MAVTGLRFTHARCDAMLPISLKFGMINRSRPYLLQIKSSLGNIHKTFIIDENKQKYYTEIYQR